MVVIYWFRRDLRLKDNTGLIKASRDFDEVLPLYIVDKDIFESEFSPGEKRFSFWRNSLKELHQEIDSLGGNLLVEYGDPLDIFRRLVDNLDIDGVYFNRDYTPYSRKRDEKIFSSLEIDVQDFKDLVFHEKKEILTSSNTPYKVFSYYYKKWKKNDKRMPRKKTSFSFLDPDSKPIPEPEYLGYDVGTKDSFFTGGRSEALKLLDSFREKVDDYHELRDYPAEKGTSYLSPHLKFGNISIREAYWLNQPENPSSIKKNRISEGLEAWRRQLAWRDFYFQQIWNWPELINKPAKKKYRDIEWLDRPEEWNALKEGITGYPFIDAGIRQLNKIGWIHNRPRMTIASFAAKDLHIDWRLLDNFFREKLIDFERPSMTGGIHWSYSIGADSQPYFRVFNPITQAKKHDPEGKYIKRYIPELSDVPKEHIHEPGEMPIELQKEIDCKIGKDYPEKIVNHSKRREKALEIYESVQK